MNTMTDDRPHGRKGRSASICATSSASMEAISASTCDGVGTPQQRRRRPAIRSQSARISNNRRSIKSRPVTSVSTSDKGQSNSEPKLAETSTPDISPCIRRKGSQKKVNSGNQRRSTAFLDIPDTKHGDSNEESDDSYRLRTFSSSSKGIVNRGDSFRRRRSRSNSTIGAGPIANIDIGDHNVPISNYLVALLGPQGVGKTALINQFMTSECINVYDRQKDVSGAQTITIMLNGEESELTFLNVASAQDIDRTRIPHAFVLVYSVVDKASFLRAETEMTRLQDCDLLRSRPVIVVGNKIDLARSRAVSTQDGKCLACTFRAKFIEISVGINHNVDELLVGILSQIKLKAHNFEVHDHHHQWYKNRSMVKASMKARQMFTWLFGKEDSKFKNCENLHIL